MEVVANSYLPGDPHLVDKIVYELKAQGIFDQFRKECFADVDTKPAYQNLRQRVEGSVAGFLKEQSWRPDMNKNQVREMLRKTITESGYLETGVERIVDQVVNPKINTVFLPKVEEVVYSYLGIKKPNKSESVKSEPCDLLPNDLEAVSPESDHDKKEEKSVENLQELDESKTEEDESPPFEPLEEQSVYVPQEENSVDSHLSGFSVSHESNQSNENKVTPMEQDSQMSRNSSDSRLSIVTSDDNSKMEICEDSQPKSIKSNETNTKSESDKNKHKSSDRHKSRSETKSDRDRKSSKDSRSRHSSSSKDKDKSRDRKDSKTTSSSNKNDKDKLKEKTDKDKSKSSSSSSKHTSHTNSNNNSNSSSSKDKNGKKESSKSDKDKDRKSSSSSHKDSKLKDRSSDSKTKEKSSSDKHRHSSSHSDKHKKDKDKENKDKKKDKSKDDHYSSRDKKNDRRSTDRDSNDGQSSKQNSSHNNESNSSQSQKSSQESSGGGDSGNSDQSEHTTKAPINVSEAVEATEITISAPESQKLKLFKPKCASNMQEALRLRKIRKQLAKLEKKNQLSLTSVNLDSPILLNASINLDDLNQNCIEDEKVKQETLNNKIVSELEVVPSPLQNTVISQDNWDAMEAKLRKEVSSEFKQINDESLDNNSKDINDDEIEDCKYFENVDIKKIEFLLVVEKFIREIEKQNKLSKDRTFKRKVDDTDVKNNNNKQLVSPDKKAKLLKKNKEKFNHSDLLVSEKFPLPLSPAESDKSFGKKEDGATMPLKVKRNSISKLNSQRYSSDDLYKPRPTFASSRRRGAKNLEN